MLLGTLVDLIARVLGIGLLVFMLWVLLFPGWPERDERSERTEAELQERHEREPQPDQQHRSLAALLWRRGH